MDKGLSKATFTVRELAQYLNIGRAAAYRLVNEGVISSLRIGKQIRIPIAAVQRWLEEAALKGA